MKIGTLTLDITANTASLVEGVNKVETSLSDIREKTNKFAADHAKAFAFAAVGAAAGLAAIIKSAADAGKEISAMSATLNMSSETLQKMNFAGATVGIDNIGNVMKDVNDKVGTFLSTGGGPLNDWFNDVGMRAGVTAASLRTMSSQQVMGLVVSTSQAAGASTAQLSHYMKSLSGDADKLIPLLANGAKGMNAMMQEATDLGIVLSDKEVFNLNALSTSIQMGMSLITSLKNHIGAQLAPVITAATKLFTDWVKSMGGMESASTTVVNTLVSGFAFVANAIDGVGRISTFVWYTMKAGILSIGSAIMTLVELIGNTLLGSMKNLAEVGALLKLPGAQAAADFIGGLQQGISQFSNSVTDAAVQAATDAAKAASDIVAKPLAGDVFKQYVEKAKKEADKNYENSEKPSTGGAGVAGAGVQQDPRIQQLIDYNKTREQLITDQYNKEWDLIKQQVARGAITEEQALDARYGAAQKYSDAMKALDAERFQTAVDGTSQMFGNLSTLMNTHSRSMFEVGKAAAISQAIIDTYSGAQKAFTSLAGIPFVGPALGIAAAAAAVVAGMARVQSISSQQFGSGTAGVSSTQAVNNASTPTGSAGGGAVQNVYLRGVDLNSFVKVGDILGVVNNQLKNGGKLLIGAGA